MSQAIEIKRRDDAELTFTITDENGVGQVLTDDQLTLTVKNSREDDDSEAIMQRIYLLDDKAYLDGVKVIQLSNEDTDLPPGNYVYDLQWKRIATGNSAIATPFDAAFVVTQDVTHTK